jgi:hypothetical protein
VEITPVASGEGSGLCSLPRGTEPRGVNGSIGFAAGPAGLASDAAALADAAAPGGANAIGGVTEGGFVNVEEGALPSGTERTGIGTDGATGLAAGGGE